MIAQKIRTLFNTVAFYDATRNLRSDADNENWDVLISALDAALCSLGFVRQYTKHPEWIEDRNYYMGIAAFRQSHESDQPHLLVYHELRDRMQLIDCSTISGDSIDAFISDLIQYLDQHKLQIQNT